MTRPVAKPPAGNLGFLLGVAAATVVLLAIGIATVIVIANGNCRFRPGYKKDVTTKEPVVVAGGEKKEKPKKSVPVPDQKKTDKKDKKSPDSIPPSGKESPITKPNTPEEKVVKEQPKPDPEKAKPDLTTPPAEDKNEQEFTRLVAEGDKALEGKNYKEAVTAYEKARVLFPMDEGVFQKLDTAEKALAAQAVQEQNAKLREENAGLKQQADTALEAKKYVQAADLYKKYLALVTDDPDATQGLADAEKALAQVGTPEFQARVAAVRKAMMAGQLLEAAQELAAARRLNPTSPIVDQLAMQLEQLALAQNDPNATKGEDQDKKNKANYDSLVQLAVASRNVNRWSDAEQYYRLALQFMPEDPSVKQALIDLGQAKAQATQVFNQMMARGAQLLQQQLPSNAIECFKAADQAFPEKDAVRGLIQQAQALLASQQRYFAAMQQGQALMNQKNYQQARDAPLRLLWREFPQEKAALDAWANANQLVLNPPGVNPPPVVVVVNPNKTTNPPADTKKQADQKKTAYNNAMKSGLAAWATTRQHAITPWRLTSFSHGPEQRPRRCERDLLAQSGEE